jgi:menaquinone-dependent protoporphyrinogen oxidase
MTNKILVAYASSTGSTTGVAEAIGRALTEANETVDVRPIQSVTGLEGYRAAVIGSAVHGGKWLPEAVDFVQTHQAGLCQMPTAFFLVCMMLASGSEANRNYVPQFLEAQRALVKPVSEGRFAGALFPNKVPFFTGMGLRIFSAYLGLGFRGGDYRDMGAVRAWSMSIRPLLAQ